jgi:hypothetical protein
VDRVTDTFVEYVDVLPLPLALWPDDDVQHVVAGVHTVGVPGTGCFEVDVPAGCSRRHAPCSADTVAR